MQSMRPTHPHIVEPRRIMRLDQSRFGEPWKGANHQAVVFDFNCDGCLQPRGMPRSKDAAAAAMPEITSEPLQRELSERAGDARIEGLARLKMPLITKTTALRAATNNTPQTSYLVFVV